MSCVALRAGKQVQSDAKAAVHSLFAALRAKYHGECSVWAMDNMDGEMVGDDGWVASDKRLRTEASASEMTEPIGAAGGQDESGG